MEAVDAVGVLADLHVRALLLEEKGLDEGQIGTRLGVPTEAVPNLLRVARRKLEALEGRPGSLS